MARGPQGPEPHKSGCAPHGREIVLCSALQVGPEMARAESQGRRILGWEHDEANHTAFIYLERGSGAERPCSAPAATPDSWAARLRALEALPSPRPHTAPSALALLAAWVRTRRTKPEKGGKV